MDHVYVALERDSDGYPPLDTEEIHAREVSPGEYEIVSAPTFVKAVAVGDIVKTEMYDGLPWMTQTLVESSHWLARVIPFTAEPQHVVDVFTSMGCVANATQYKIITVDVPPEAGADHVLAELEAGAKGGDWDYEVPVVPPSMRA